MKEQEKIQLKREIENQKKMYPRNTQCSDKDRKDKRNVKLKKKTDVLMCV